MIDTSYTILGALIGFLVVMTGVGGGALMTPILLLFFGVEPLTAIATDMWFAAITKIVGAMIQNNAGQVDWQVVRRMWVGSLPMALLVVLMVVLGGPIVKVTWLMQAIASLIILTALGLIFAPILSSLARERRLNNPVRFRAVQPVLTVLAGATLGICVSLTSVGAGALGSLAMMYIYPLRMTPHRLVATDLVHAIPLAVVAGLVYLFAGMVDWDMLISLLIGSVPAGVLGSLLMPRISGRWIQISLAIVLLLAGLKMLVG